MILYFANRDFVVQGLASTNNDSKYVITADKKVESIANHVCTFEADISFLNEDRVAIEQLIAPGNYILRYDEPTSKTAKNSEGLIAEAYSSNNVTDCFTIIETEIDTYDGVISIYAEDLGLDLLNDLVYSYTPSTSMTVSGYINKTLEKTGFTVSDDSDTLPVKKYLAWDSSSTITERLNSIADAFECDIFYSFDIRGVDVVAKHINVKAKRGAETYEVLSIGKNLNNITVKKTVANLATALIATGEGGVDLYGYTYDDGDFYISEGVLYSRNALSNWYRYKHNTGHIYRQYQSSATSQVDLKDDAIKQLKKIREPEVNYDVNIAFLPDNISIGDRVFVVDDNAELYISGRILELRTSAVSKTQEATIGDYITKTSGISSMVLDLAEQFKEIASNRSLYTWMMFANDEHGADISLNEDGRTYVGLLTNMSKELTDISQITPALIDKATWQKIRVRESVAINLESAGGLIFKNRSIETTITAILTAGDETIQTLEALQLYFATTDVRLAWYIKTDSNPDFREVTSGVSDDGFTFTYSDTTNRNVSVKCSIVMEV